MNGKKLSYTGAQQGIHQGSLDLFAAESNQSYCGFGSDSFILLFFHRFDERVPDQELIDPHIREQIDVAYFNVKRFFFAESLQDSFRVI